MCPTCSHTMQSVGRVENGARIFWCNRCGTLRSCAPLAPQDWVDDSRPMLVNRVRELIIDFPLTLPYEVRGIIESIYPESERS